MAPPPTSEPSAKVIARANGTVVRIEGVIDESFELSALTGPHEVVLLDLDGVNRINSVGIKRWREGLCALEAQYLCFVRAQSALVSQFNIVPEFGCGGELISFYLPYLCPRCDRVATVLLDLRKDRERLTTAAAPEEQCTCGAMMEFDDFAEYYLRYARVTPPPSPPAAAEALLDEWESTRGS